MPHLKAVKQWENQGVMDVKKLVSSGFLTISRGLFQLYQVGECVLDNGASHFIGQVDEDGEPNGIGRLIYKDGPIIEGQIFMLDSESADENEVRETVPQGFVRHINSRQQSFTWFENKQ